MGKKRLPEEFQQISSGKTESIAWLWWLSINWSSADLQFKADGSTATTPAQSHPHPNQSSTKLLQLLLLLLHFPLIPSGEGSGFWGCLGVDIAI